MCPICTVGIAVGAGLSRYLKIDDLISGIWIGALLIYLTLWSILWLKNKRVNLILSVFISFVFWYLLTLAPLYYYGIIGDPNNKILGVDKLIAGIILGSILLFLVIKLNEFIKKKKNKVLFPFQKVIIPISILLIVSIIIYLITKL